jgi:hypothetical protein
MPIVTVNADQGGSLVLVAGDGTSSVYNIPPGAIITIQGQRGFGDAVEAVTGASFDDAMTEVTSEIGSKGAR